MEEFPLQLSGVSRAFLRIVKDDLIGSWRSVWGRSSGEGGEQQQAASEADHSEGYRYSEDSIGVVLRTYTVYKDFVEYISGA